MKTNLERRNEMLWLWLPILLSGLLIAFLLAAEGENQVFKKPTVYTVVYDCINIHHAPPPESYPPDHAAYYALIRLQAACEQQENALALMHIWQQDPAAGEVLEP